MNRVSILSGAINVEVVMARTCFSNYILDIYLYNIFLYGKYNTLYMLYFGLSYVF